jgi:acyl-CoA thioester hydrolase
VTRRFTHPMRVRFAECDPQGIVFNSRYLEYFDVAMTEFWRDVVGPYEQATDDAGVDLVVAEAGVRYRDSLHFDDEFELRAIVAHLGTTSMTTAIEVVRDRDIVAEGELRHVFVDTGDARPTPIPEPIRTAFEPYLAGDE